MAALPDARGLPPVLIYQVRAACFRLATASLIVVCEAAGTDVEQAYPNLRGYVSWAANLTGKGKWPVKL